MSERPSNMPRSAEAIVGGVGARTVSGLTALQVTMSARAQRFLLRESHLIDAHGEPIGVARLPSIGDNIHGLARFVLLGSPAMLQALFPLRESLSRRGIKEGPVPVVIALPEEARPGLDPMLKTHLLQALAARSRAAIDRDRSSLSFGGRAAGAAAIERAMELLEEGAEAVLCGGIDTMFDPEYLDHLDGERRLHALDTENGFIPGEGAAFLLLVSSRTIGQIEPLATITSVALEREPRPYGSPDPCLGVGLTQAVRRAVAGAQPFAWVLTDVSNERHRVDEWTYAFARNHGAFRTEVAHEQPLLKTGDVGAASIPMLVTMAAVRWNANCAVSQSALVVGASDGPLRCAVALRQRGKR
jgi:3-oxoacyl-[acyl-carrier-protein] synthase I